MTYEVEMTNMCMVHDTVNDRVLIQHRVKGWKGVAFPGGHVEPNEALVPSVIREVQEETGLTIEAPRLCGVVHWANVATGQRTLISYFYTDRYAGTLLSATGEGRNEWIPRASLRDMPLAPWFDEQLRVFEDDSVCECFYSYENREGKTIIHSVDWY